MPVYPQDIYRAIDRRWLDRAARAKLPFPEITKAAASARKKHSVQRERRRIAEEDAGHGRNARQVNRSATLLR